MKIANPESLMLKPAARADAVKTLAAGQALFISAGVPDWKGSSLLPADLTKHIELGGNATATLTISKSFAKELDVPGMKVGSVTGMFAGAAIGVILDQIKAVHPTSAAVFEAACATIGAAAGTAVGSGKFTVKPTWEKGKFGVEVAHASIK